VAHGYLSQYLLHHTDGDVEAAMLWEHSQSPVEGLFLWNEFVSSDWIMAMAYKNAVWPYLLTAKVALSSSGTFLSLTGVDLQPCPLQKPT
jgi:hypothetical protein